MQGILYLMYVVVEELISEMSKGEHAYSVTNFFSLGFVRKMFPDAALG